MNSPIQEILANKGSQVFTCAPDVMVATAVAGMNARKVGSLVVTEQDALCGIFTERDVLERVIDGGLDPNATPVGEAMTTNPITISPSVTVKQAMVLITEKRCRHLPVTDNGRLVGMVSIGDLLRWMVYDQEHEIDELRHYITDTRAGAEQTTFG